MPDDDDTPAPTGAQLGALLDAAIRRLRSSDGAVKDNAARTAREILNFLAGRQNIGDEHDPAKIAIVRRVAAQILFANPGVLVSHQQHLLALRLINLNEGQIGPLIRPTGGASNILQERKNGLEGRSGCGRAGTPAVERRSAGSSSERSASRAAWSCPPVTAEPLELEPQLGLARSAAIARVTTRAVGSPSFSNRPVVSRQAAKKPPNVDAFAARPPGSSFHASRRSPTGSPLWGLAPRSGDVRVLAARLAALASFVRPRLARSRQRLVAASRALRFGRRRGLCHHLAQGFEPLHGVIARPPHLAGGDPVHVRPGEAGPPGDLRTDISARRPTISSRGLVSWCAPRGASVARRSA